MAELSLVGLELDSVYRGRRTEEIFTAREVLRVARLDAERIVAQASQSANDVRTEAEKRGYLEGILRAAANLSSAAELSREALVCARRKILDLGIEVARAVVGREIAERPESILLRVDEALSFVKHTATGQLDVHRDDLPLFETEVFTQGAAGSLRVRPNEDLARGSFILRTDLGELHADLGEHILRLRDALAESNGPSRIGS